MKYKEKIFINENQVSLNLVFNQLQMERLFINMDPGDVIKYVGEASDAEEASDILGLNKLKNSDRELYYYIAATFVSLATMTNETEIYRNVLEDIMRTDFNNEEEVLNVKALIKNIFQEVDTLYHLEEVETLPDEEV